MDRLVLMVVVLLGVGTNEGPSVVARLAPGDRCARTR
jgi:hypothetical protein